MSAFTVIRLDTTPPAITWGPVTDAVPGLGSVGTLKGIRTNTGNVQVTAATGDIVVLEAIDTTGSAPASVERPVP